MPLARCLALAGVLMLVGCTTSAPVPTPSGVQITAAPTTGSPTPTSPPPSPPPAPSSSPSSTPASPSPSVAPAPSETPFNSPSASASPAPSTASGRPTFAAVDDAYQQPIDWHNCVASGAAATCATVYVPTDYDEPSAGTTALAVARFAAQGTAQGDLFINPGGPGSGGIGFASYIARSASGLSLSYNVVGFDPRGTGESDPLTCLGTADFDILNDLI